mmetsp:Transcript_62668/g.104290  ORF Transcript_62668/g.104290 Transcript_62668/m.104290 type:complete len:88 (+) Transcript_62668:188-451(+)
MMRCNCPKKRMIALKITQLKPRKAGQLSDTLHGVGAADQCNDEIIDVPVLKPYGCKRDHEHRGRATVLKANVVELHKKVALGIAIGT